jgi:hypothetical protein
MKLRRRFIVKNNRKTMSDSRFTRALLLSLGTAPRRKALSMSMAKKLRPHELRNLALAADLELEDAWRVEYFDSDGAGYITIFTGQSAELRARDYYDAIERGTLNTRIADAMLVTAKPVASFLQKRRRRVR